MEEKETKLSFIGFLDKHPIASVLALFLALDFISDIVKASMGK